MGKRLRTAGARVILIAAGALIVIALGAPEKDRGAGSTTVQAEVLVSPASAVSPVSSAPVPVSAATSPTSDGGSPRPFPILPIVGGLLVVMTFALHCAAWRWAQ